MTSDPSREHIIPLSLGRHKDFIINVDRKFNSDVGSKIDGRIAGDFLILFDRDNASAKGHSRKHPQPIVKSASLRGGTPAQVIFSKNGLKIFDLKDKRFLDKSDSRGNQVQIKGTIDFDIDMMFIAKVALAAGYYSYQENFLNHVDHSEFRKIMNLDKNNLLVDSKAFAYNRFYKPVNNDAGYHIKKLATEIGCCSSIVMLPSENYFGVGVALLGRFLGYISVPSESKYLPNEKEYRYGHCIYLQDGIIYRYSFDHIRKKLIQIFDDNKRIQADVGCRLGR